jgi:hypothetical protein
VKRLVIAVVVLVGLLVAADYATAAIAESAVSRQMREQLGLTDDPDVRINGFPFLTQAISGQYGSVDIAADHLPLGPLREVEVRAQLRDVDAPLSMLLGSGPKSLKVDDADGTVRVDADDLERLMPGVRKVRIENVDAGAIDDLVEEGAPVSLRGIDTDSAARVVGTVDVPVIGETEVAVIVSLQLDGRVITLVPRDVRIADSSGDRVALPSVVQSALQKAFSLRVDPGILPFEVVPTVLRARDGTLEISGTVKGVVIGDGGTVGT